MNKCSVSWVVNDMNSTNLKSFKIFGLFDRYDIDLPFNREVNIFIGENGLGKTTILNCLYYVLEKKYVQLEAIPFHRIEVDFRFSNAPVVIKKADIIAYNKQSRNGRRAVYDEDYLYYLLAEFQIAAEDLDTLSTDEFELIAQRYSAMQGIPIPMARKRLATMLDLHSSTYMHKYVKGDKKNVQALSQMLKENLHERIIYLPTYRRIENDFSNLNIRNEEINNSEMLIRFGMSDVQKYIDTILDQIRKLAVEGFNKMTGLLLGQYTNGDNMRYDYNTIDLDIVKIILDRLEDKIDSTTKQNIIRLINTKEIYYPKYQHLLNLLHRLIASYDQQKRYDDRINGFVNTCNKYLNDKHFRYNPSDLTLRIYLDDANTNQSVKLTQLSSGEKQIVSLFSKLYLESDESSIVIIDEPELSLSIKWQQMLLPDIMRSNNCKLLLTVTHSPFIFENEFDMDAREIRAYMKER